MDIFYRASVALITALGVVVTSEGAQPPDVVTSDASQNTAMGSNALFNLTTGADNTAAGDGALFSNNAGCWARRPLYE